MSNDSEKSPWFLEHGAADAPLLLCLHGIGSCGSAFEPQKPLAATCNRRLVAWDAPGYRHSPDPAQPFTLDDWADAAAALIRAQGKQAQGDTGNPGPSADVLGVSWGGVTATRLALRHPELVRSLVLADSSVGSGTDPGKADAMRGRATAVDELGIEEFARARTPNLVTSNASADLLAIIAGMMADSVRQPAYTWACAAMAEADHRQDLASIDIPTLVVVGDGDIVTPPERSDELTAGIPGARLVTIPDAGHLANQERPDIFNAAVAEFLQAL